MRRFATLCGLLAILTQAGAQSPSQPAVALQPVPAFSATLKLPFSNLGTNTGAGLTLGVLQELHLSLVITHLSKEDDYGFGPMLMVPVAKLVLIFTEWEAGLMWTVDKETWHCSNGNSGRTSQLVGIGIISEFKLNPKVPWILQQLSLVASYGRKVDDLNDKTISGGLNMRF